MDSALRARIEDLSMQFESRHAQSRLIRGAEAHTPLLVPSFSSRGFPCVSEIFAELRGQLYGVCLVSASDLSACRIPPDVSDVANLIVVDSGRYEAEQAATVSTSCYMPPSIFQWSRSLYHDALSAKVNCDANFIAVNYDKCGPIETQFEQANEDFALVPDATKDILIKPENQGDLVNVAKLSRYDSKLSGYDVIGVAARELGDSLIERCRAIVMLRDILNDFGLATPIHVFGAIRPAEVLAFFFCGADIFDGLGWLKSAFRDGASVHIDEAAFEEHKWNLRDEELTYYERVYNLRTLYRLQQLTQSYAVTGDRRELMEQFSVTSKAARVAHLAGADI